MSPDNSPLGMVHELFHLAHTTALQRLRCCPHYTDEDEGKEII